MRRCARLVALAAAVIAAGCATDWRSPREPYATPEVAVDADAAFDVLADWRWTDAVRSDGNRSAVARSALSDGMLGLFSAQDFRIAGGACEGCALPDAVLWHFEHELIAVPRPGLARAGFEVREPIGLKASDESRHARPAVIWIGAPERVTGARVRDDGLALVADGGEVALALAPRLPGNSAFADASSARFFAARTVTLRGATRYGPDSREQFVARSIWPEDARIEASGLHRAPLRANETIGTLVEAQSHAEAGAFPARLLWERTQAARRDWAGRPAIALLLSGAQGDDDGSRGGHLGIASGVFGPHGEWDHWLVENFYPVEEPNAKGIVPASVPVDKYLTDLNSGQLWYRPGYMLIAVLREPTLASAIQSALHTGMIDLYCRDVRYNRARNNSTAMTIDPLRGLGWRIPSVGASSRVLGLMLAPLAAAAGRSFGIGRDLFGALAAERTRLLPRVAFEVIAHDLLYLVATESDQRGDGGRTPFEQMLADRVEAIVFVRLPQIPSSRRFGSYPVRSMLAYGAQVFAKPGSFEVAPAVHAREFPAGLAASCAGR